MAAHASDLNLLCAVVALQNELVHKDDLLTAMNAWGLEKHRAIVDILVEQKALGAEDRELLDRLIARQLQRHGSPEQSLAAVQVAPALKYQLQSLCHSDLEASLIKMDAPTTCSYVVGAPTSAGSRFRIIRPHAEGGLGKVSVARDDELDREVALKEIKEQHAHHENSRGRFVREAEITGGLEHPGIVPVYGMGAYADGRPFYVMRFIRGDNMRQAIARFHGIGNGGRQGSLSAKVPTHDSPYPIPFFSSLEFRQLLGRFIDVCNAVAYAHSRGVLHRDLKPGNIMLGKYGETLVVDWGLAKASGETAANGLADGAEPPLRPRSASSVQETVAGVAVGTPAYMSPEQAAGRLDLLSPASDIYSLGATLYTLLFNRAPIDDKDTGEVLRKVQAGEIVWRPLGPDRNRVSKPLVAICRKAMALRPDDRYATPLALAEDLEHWLADDPVGAYREPWPVRAGRWARKHKPVVATAAAILVTATLGLAAGLFFVNEERHRTEQARIAADQAKEKANTEAAMATAVKNFLKSDLLELATARNQNREERLGTLTTDPNLKVRDLVLRAAKKIDGKFPHQPLVEAEIRSTLGWTLYELGRADLAIPQFQRLRQLNTTQHGPEHFETLRSMNFLASAYDAADRPKEALKLREETLQIQKVQRGPEHLDTLDSMNNLASSYHDAGRIQEALELREKTLEVRRNFLGPDHADTLVSMNNLAISYTAAGRAEDGLKLNQETLKLRIAKFGLNDPATLLTMNNLASSYHSLGRAADALRLREKTLKLQKAVLPPDHPHTLMSMHSLALSYRVADRTPEEIALREELLQIQRTKFGPANQSTLTNMMELATAYETSRRFPEALVLREQTFKAQKDALGPNHPDTLKSMNNLAASYAHARRFQEALELGKETVRLQKAMLGPDEPETLMCMNNLVDTYIDLKQADAALKLLEETLMLREKRLAKNPGAAVDQAFVAHTHAQIGLAEQVRHDYVAAARAYGKAVELFETLDKAGALKLRPFRERLEICRKRLVVCRHAEQAINDLDFALKQPPADLALLLDRRVRYLLYKQQLPAAVATAAQWKEWAKTKTDFYNAACLYALCAADAKIQKPVPPPALAPDALAEEAMKLLARAVAEGFADAAHLRTDSDLDVLRERVDFQKLQMQLESKKS